jgi:twinkle protein
MTALECATNTDLYRKQSEFVRNLKKIASKYNVCIVLVAHPRKESSNDNRGFQNDDISGSADITNRVDVVMVYSRAKAKEGVKLDWDSELIITKNRLTGKLISPKNPIKLEYSQKSKRIVQLGDKTPKAYGWENTQPTVYEEPPF